MNTDHQMAAAASAAPMTAVSAGGENVNKSHSSQELDRDHPARASGNKDREGLRASQSFDESVFLRLYFSGTLFYLTLSLTLPYTLAALNFLSIIDSNRYSAIIFHFYLKHARP